MTSKVRHRMGDKNLLSRAPPCLGGTLRYRLHLPSLAPTPVSTRVDVRQAAGRKYNCRIFITNDEKHIVSTTHLVWEKSREKKKKEVIQEAGLYLFNVHKIAEKLFSISIATVRSRSGSLLIKLHASDNIMSTTV
jgi:hypothetical protein